MPFVLSLSKDLFRANRHFDRISANGEMARKTLTGGPHLLEFINHFLA